MSSCQTPLKQSDAVFKKILKALMEGGVVPFVGAGISIDATVRPFEPRIGRGQYLWDRLHLRIYSELKASVRQRNWNRVQLGRAALGTAKSRTFGTMAEVCQWLVGDQELCETLEIPKFIKLPPRPAHYAIGCLALEGLLDEVISTNWDTCLERALQELSRPQEHYCKPITDLASYREYGARRRGPHGEAILRLHKINGCAAEYEQADAKGRSEVAKHIIITERQLQDFGKRRWARELLRDRARSRTLVFSGFGSDEPQVRHTVLELMDEFSEDGHSSNGNKLFVVAYERQLSFTQQQILRAFVGGKKENGKPTEDAVLDLSLSGQDADYFKVKTNSLPADHFWCALFEAAIEQLLRKRYTNRGFALQTWLGRWSHEPKALKKQLLDWVFPPNDSTKSAFRCAQPGLFGPHPTEQGFILMRWIETMRGRDVVPSTTPPYCALRGRQEPLLPLATLMTLYKLATLDRPHALPLGKFIEQNVTTVEGHGLKVQVSQKGMRSAEVVYLVAEGGDDLTTPELDGQGENRVQLMITVPTSITNQAQSRAWEQLGPERRRLLRRQYIPAHELLKLNKDNTHFALAQLFADRKDSRDKRRNERLRSEETPPGGNYVPS